MRNHPLGEPIDYRLVGDFVDRAAGELLANEAAGPGHGAVQDVLVMRAGGVVLLLVFAVHHHEVDVRLVDEVSTVGVTEVVQGRIVHEGTDTAHGDASEADVRVRLGEAFLGVDALGGDFLVEVFQEAGTTEDQGRLAAEAGELANFLAEEFADLLLAGNPDDGVGADGRAVAPLDVGSTVDTSDGAGGGVVRDQRREAGNDLGVLGAVEPEHLVEGAGPAFRHVLELFVEDAGEDREVALGVLGRGGAGGGIDDGKTVVLQLGERQRDASMDFLPGERGALRIGRVGVRDGVVVGETSDRGRVVKRDRDADVALAAGESLLLAGEGFEQGLVLDVLGEGRTLDVVVEGRRGDVSEFGVSECHGSFWLAGLHCSETNRL